MTWLYVYFGIGLLLGFLVCFWRDMRPTSSAAFFLALLTLVLFWPLVVIGGVIHSTRRRHGR